MHRKAWAVGWVVMAAAAAIGGGPAYGARRHIAVMGATSVTGYVKAALPAWESRHPGCTVSVTGGGSVAGLWEVAQGHVDIGVSDIAPPKGAGRLRRFVLGRIPVVMVTGRQSGVRHLSAARLRDVLAGSVGRWSAVGGSRLKVTVVVRQPASGARAVVERTLLRGVAFSRRAVVQLSNGAVLTTVLDTPGAIGFVEVTGPIPASLVVLAIGPHRFSPQAAGQWPYYAEPTLYLAPKAHPCAVELARHLAHSPLRRTYGIYPVPERRRPAT